ncbi:MAG TPA: hypothetical protein IAA98_05045 [Candidatus Avipropionibacterium avicola]|uniref:Uncharacterized protein n=1 Tax=Candidatus Avipropionibacterium avicola TaxID=2840701 RepID=A0A9D1GXA1_9ACTN|nr:hypothetical protein [Candidatus Avipropionibacterium avicola]
MPDPTRHARRYATRFTIGMATYVVLLVVALLAADRLDGIARMLVMLLPVPGVLLVAWALWRYLVDADEMVRRDQLVSLALAFGLGSIITFTYGLLQLAGAPELGWVWVFPVYAGCWLLAHLVQTLRNR